MTLRIVASFRRVAARSTSPVERLASPGFVAVLVALGLVVHVQGPEGVAALCCVFVASMLLLLQAGVIRNQWNRSIES